MKCKSNFIDFLKMAREMAWPTTTYLKCILEILNLQKLARLSGEIAADVQLSFHHFLTLWSRILREANRFSASQEIPRILWKPKIHYCICKCPPPVPILSNNVFIPTIISWYLK